MSATLQIRAEGVDFGDAPFTAAFEKYVLEHQAQGQTLLGFHDNEGSNEFTFIFGQVREAMNVAASLRQVVVAPWSVYLYGYNQRYYVPKGHEFIVLRLVDTYADMLEVGDPVELVDAARLVPVGTAEVVSLTKVRVGDIVPTALGLVYPHVTGQRDVANKLSEEYSQAVSLDTTVAMVRLRAMSTVGGKRTFYGGMRWFGESIINTVRSIGWFISTMHAYMKVLFFLCVSTLMTLVWIFLRLLAW